MLRSRAVAAGTTTFKDRSKSSKYRDLGLVSRTAVWLAALAVVACDQAPGADGLPEWKPGDHHSADDNGAAQGGAGGPGASGPQGPGGPQAAPAPRGGDPAQLVELAWRQQCMQCHGAAGHGDGPMGAMLHARDLSDPDWQSKVTDADIAAGIRNGKNKMPKYDLPAPVVEGLVGRIRQMKGT
jgi:Cytochrome C oxidase, cbb3-type, subunit III